MTSHSKQHSVLLYFALDLHKNKLHLSTMPGCAIVHCNNYNRRTKNKEIKYFTFPKNEEFKKKWIHACRRSDNINLKNACVCSDHFDSSCFEIPLRQQLLKYSPKNSRNLKIDAVPTLNLPLADKTKKHESRTLRLSKRRQRREVNDILKESYLTKSTESENNAISETPTVASPSELPTLIKMEQDIAHKSIDTSECKIKMLQEKIEILEREKHELIKEVQNVKDSTVRYYESILAKILTPGQIIKLINPETEKQIHWNPEDIASAISLRRGKK